MNYNRSITSLAPHERKLALKIVRLFRNGNFNEAKLLIEEGKASKMSGFDHIFIDFLYDKSLGRKSQTNNSLKSDIESAFSIHELKNKLSHDLADNFKSIVINNTECIYKKSEEIKDEPIVGKLLSAKTVAEQEKILPYKGKIFLPTNKYSEPEQIFGINKTAAYLSTTNTSTTQARLMVLKDLIHKSGFSECLIIANGPSLKTTNIAMYDNAFIIGLNSIFLHPYITPHAIVCEDHLVGEDRSVELNNHNHSIKIIPGYLTYCIDPDDLTIVLNHRPRISFPVDIDFSGNVDQITYTGGTVTYTALQLAVGLGFKQIYLVGVDASYKVENVKEQNDYATGILESLGDDPNHFNSGYFGKGYRWHDPNPLRMMQAYSVARRYAEYHGINIVNLTRGGMLDVFKREDYQNHTYHRYPKVCVIDWIDINSKAATGEVKKALFKDWPKDKLLHIFSPKPSDLSVFRSTLGDVFIPEHSSILAAWKSIIEFNPSGYYWRPTHNRPLLNLFAALLFLIERKPYAFHLMDYWTTKVENEKLRENYDQAIEYSIRSSAHFFVISQRMKSRLCNKYNLESGRVTVAHNYCPASLAIDASSPAIDRDKRQIFYSGNLDPDQSIDPLIDICRAIQSLNDKGPVSYEFIIRTSDSHIKNNSQRFSEFNFIKLKVQSDSFEEYIYQMAKADLCILCYGFGVSSREYLLDSMANKLPDLIASKTKFFAYGDLQIGTLNYLQTVSYPFLEEERNIQKIASSIDTITSMNYSEYANMCANSFNLIMSEFSEMAQCHVFQKQLSSCILDEQINEVPDKQRETLASSYDKIYYHSELKITQSVREEIQLMKFLAHRPEITNAVYQDVRKHGLSWSINTTKQDLEKNISKIPADPDLVVKSLAWMIASQRHKRFEDLWSQLFQKIIFSEL